MLWMTESAPLASGPLYKWRQPLRGVAGGLATAAPGSDTPYPPSFLPAGARDCIFASDSERRV